MQRPLLFIFLEICIKDKCTKPSTKASNGQNKEHQQSEQSPAQKYLHFPEDSKIFVWKHFLISFGGSGGKDPQDKGRWENKWQS